MSEEINTQTSLRDPVNASWVTASVAIVSVVVMLLLGTIGAAPSMKHIALKSSTVVVK